MAATMIWDYVVFAVFVVCSAAYPIWHERRGRQGQATTKRNYVFATGRVSVFAIMMSVARGTLGVRTIIGYPSEQFYRGSAMFECIYGIIIAYPLVVWLFVPVYVRLDITSVYQYLDLRFGSRLVRALASATFIARSLLTMCVTIYTPCVAMHTIMGVPFWASLMTLTGISICFTLFGGLKAAITADVIQGVTIIAVSLLVVIKGVMYSGGLQNVYDINEDTGRFQFLRVGDWSTRVDTVSATLGQAFMQISLLGCQQNMVQRYMSLGSEKEINKTLFFNIPFVTLLYLLPWICGTVVYSTYAFCDPLKLGLTRKPDEILPFFVLDKLLVIPGCVGIFLATLFNGALCIYVSNLNSLATVLWEDFVAQTPYFRDFQDTAQLRAIKAIGIGFAMCAFGGAFLVGMLTGVVETAQLVAAATTGPLVGVFLLAMFVPVANWKGATAGMFVTIAATVVWATGFLMNSRSNPLMQTSVEGCSNETFSPWIVERYGTEMGESAQNYSVLLQHAHERYLLEGAHQVGGDVVMLDRNADSSPDSRSVFQLTYMYYGVLGTISTILIGWLVSWCTANKAECCEEKLLNPYMLAVMRWCRGGTAEKVAPKSAGSSLPMATSQTSIATVQITV